METSAIFGEQRGVSSAARVGIVMYLKIKASIANRGKNLQNDV
jgi:hypothetical protein